ncbi:helix-turn-helix domain-containing protein [Candidatus Parcubacteria bacterium]|nr:helix-turn-helix domain-containing protein [Candidatus Parcubacteria bacterium]
MTAAVAIKKIRDGMLLTQAELAERLHVTKASICNYEKGFRVPNRRVLREILELARANNIDVKIEDLLVDQRDE